MFLKINGVDITQFIAHRGIKYTRNDVDGAATGRGTLDGNMIRDRVAIKDKLVVTCIPMTTEQISMVMKLIEPVFVTVQYLSPREGKVVTKTMYSNNVPITYELEKKDGREYWNSIEFPLVER